MEVSLGTAHGSLAAPSGFEAGMDAICPSRLDSIDRPPRAD